MNQNLLKQSKLVRADLGLNIDFCSEQSVGEQIFNQIVARLASGDLAALALLPSERELARKYRLGRQAWRSILHKLEQCGILQAENRQGWQLTAEARRIALEIHQSAASAGDTAAGLGRSSPAEQKAAAGAAAAAQQQQFLFYSSAGTMIYFYHSGEAETKGGAETFYFFGSRARDVAPDSSEP
jgi:DNA-binding transcriptional regulator YhcF (GntR family)